MYRKIKSFYQYYYPFSSEKVRKNSLFFCGGILILAFPVSLYFLSTGSGYFGAVLALLVPFFLFGELRQMVKAAEEERTKKNLEQMLSGIRHQYYRSHGIAEAVHLAAENQCGEVLLHLDKIFELLDSNERSQLLSEYRSRVRNPFYRTLLMQTVVIDEHGDEEKEGESVYLWSLSHLRRELELDYRNRRRMQHLFSGLGLVIVVPLFTLPWIRQWAIGNLPELSSFYQGAAGRAMELVILSITLAFYQLLEVIKGEKSAALQDMSVVKRLGAYVNTAARYHYRKHVKEKEKRTAQLKRVGDRRTVEEFYACQLLSMGLCVAGTALLSILFWRYGRGLEPIFLLLCLCAPGLGYCYPVVRLAVRSCFLNDRMQEEIMNFQFSIRMLMRLPGITSMELLELLEENAVIFRSSLQQCIRDFSMQEREALNTLWQMESYPAFRKLVDMFLMIDDSGITEAFRELEADMEDYQENRKLEMEILQQGRSETAMLLACIPGLLVMFGYLILPFMLECFRMLEQYNSSLSAG